MIQISITFSVIPRNMTNVSDIMKCKNYVFFRPQLVHIGAAQCINRGELDIKIKSHYINVWMIFSDYIGKFRKMFGLANAESKK